MSEGFLMGLCVGMSVATVSGLVISLLALAKVIGLEKSTHKIQYMPVPLNEESNEKPMGAEEIAKKLYGSEEY